MQFLRSFLSYAVASIMLLCGAAQSQGIAESYPVKPVLVVNPNAAGGPLDLESRVYIAKLSELLGKPFLLESKSGAGNTIGVVYVAKAAPDGYTVLATGGSFTVLPTFDRNLPFDIVKDFAPVSLMSLKPTGLIVRNSFPARTFVEYMAYAKANPGKVNFGTIVAGTNVHLVGAWLHSMNGSTVTFVHYKGAGPSIQDLMADRLDAMLTATVSVMPLIKSGKARALAVTDERRATSLPEVGTVAEQGFPGFSYSNWTGYLTPAGTPAAIVNKLSEAFAKIAKMPSVIAAIEANGGVVVGSSPAELRQRIVAESERWRKVAQDTGVKLEN